LQPAGDPADVIVVHREPGPLRPRDRPVPVHEGLHQVIPEKSGPAGDQDVLAGEFAEVRLQAVVDVVKILSHDGGRVVGQALGSRSSVDGQRPTAAGRSAKYARCSARSRSHNRPGGTSTSSTVKTSSWATSRLSRQPSATPIGSRRCSRTTSAFSHWPYVRYWPSPSSVCPASRSILAVATTSTTGPARGAITVSRNSATRATESGTSKTVR